MASPLNLLLLGAIFAVSLAIFLRPSLRSLGLVAAGVAAACTIALLLVSGPRRAQGGLVGALLLLGLGLSLLLERPKEGFYPARSFPPRRLPPPPRPKRLPPPAATPAFAPASAPGLPSFNGYEVLNRVGVGGMGSVYRARRRSDGKVVALKVPQEKYFSDTQFARRFYREAEVLSRFDHPNIVKVYDYRSRDPEHYIAMEYLDGESLEHLLETRRLTLSEAAEILRALCDAVRHIHAQNVVHRDIKPGNVMLLSGALEGGHLRAGGLKLMDFGIAVGRVLTRLTMTGARVGTPSYMAPEQAKGQHVDARSDVYSLGLLAYEMVTGSAAVSGNCDAAIHQHIFEAPKPPKQVCLEVPGKLSDLVIDMLQKDPECRPTLDEVVARLDAGVLTEDTFNDPVALLISIQEKRGALRLLDLSGKVRQGLYDVGCGLSAPPSALSSDADGNIYFSVPEPRLQRGLPLLRKLSPQGQLLLSFGPYGMDEPELRRPVSLAVAAERLYVLDAETHLVHVYTLLGEYLWRFGGRGADQGPGPFESARQLAVSGQQVLVLCRDEVQRFDLEGQYLARYAFRVDKSSADLRPLSGLCTDSQGTVYIVDGLVNKVRRVSRDDVSIGSFDLETFMGETPEQLWLLAACDDGRLFAARRGGHTLYLYSAAGDLLSSHEMYAPLQTLHLAQRR